jgi:hypothetical protein
VSVIVTCVVIISLVNKSGNQSDRVISHATPLVRDYKLNSCGIRGALMLLFNSYLSNQIQFEEFRLLGCDFV